MRLSRALYIVVGTLVMGACTADGPTAPITSPRVIGEGLTLAAPEPVRVSLNCRGSLRGTDALVVVNGAVWGRSADLAGILREPLNLDSIESVEILKGAPAVARFGPEAADGVILIQMRAGYPIVRPRD